MPDSEKKTIQGSRTSFQTRHLTKILIFTAAVGGGHEAVGQAVRAELERAGHGVVMADGLRRMSRVLDWLLVRVIPARSRTCQSLWISASP